MELYQKDDIPADVLGDSINKLYNEKTMLQASLSPVIEDDTVPFDSFFAVIDLGYILRHKCYKM